MIMLSNENFEGEMKMKINIAELTSKMSDKIMEILWWFFKPLFKMLLTFFLVALTTGTYCVGYVYDAFLGDNFIRLGHFIGKKYPKIKKKYLIWAFFFITGFYLNELKFVTSKEFSRCRFFLLP